MRADRDAERDRAALHEIVAEGFTEAMSRAGAFEHRFTIADEVIRVRFAGSALSLRLTRALQVSRSEADSVPTASIDVWDSASTGRAMPKLVAALLRLLDRTWLTERGRRGEIVDFCDDRYLAAYYGPGLLSIYDRERRHGIFWLQDASLLPWYEPGAPFRVLLDWIVGSPRRQLIHAGAIAGAGGIGVLLGGAGGSGKSTTALSCLQSGLGAPATHGLRYVSDDYVVVDLGRPTRAFGPYGTAKLKGRADVERFGGFAGAVVNLAEVEAGDDVDRQKPMMFVEEVAPERLATAMEVGGLVFPRYPGGRSECTITPATPQLAFRLLAPSTIQQIPTSDGSALRCMRTLTNELPSFVLELPDDTRLIPAGIERIIELVSSST